jgi:tetrahydromethanopterin S-methyltransferase subunit E
MDFLTKVCMYAIYSLTSFLGRILGNSVRGLCNDLYSGVLRSYLEPAQRGSYQTSICLLTLFEGQELG